MKNTKQQHQNVTNRAQNQPDFLTNYQFFERDDDDSLFSFKDGANKNEEVLSSFNKLTKSKNRINYISISVGLIDI